MSKTLSAKNLKKNYSQKNVVNNIDINLEKGEIVGLLGPNGAGKTTTFYMITGMIRPSSGTILLDDIDITKLPMYKRARMGIGYLAQEPSIFGKLTVENNLKIVLETVLPKDIDQNNLIDELLDQFNIHHLRNSLGSSLSGGERRRVEICRTLALNPDFVLLDEPFAGVDPISVSDIRALVHDLKDRGIGVLITDHNVRETLDIVSHAYILHDGKVLMAGAPDEVVANENVRRVYLGDNFKIL